MCIIVRHFSSIINTPDLNSSPMYSTARPTYDHFVQNEIMFQKSLGQLRTHLSEIVSGIYYLPPVSTTY